MKKPPGQRRCNGSPGVGETECQNTTKPRRRQSPSPSLSSSRRQEAGFLLGAQSNPRTEGQPARRSRICAAAAGRRSPRAALPAYRLITMPVWPVESSRTAPPFAFALGRQGNWWNQTRPDTGGKWRACGCPMWSRLSRAYQWTTTSRGWRRGRGVDGGRFTGHTERRGTVDRSPWPVTGYARARSPRCSCS